MLCRLFVSGVLSNEISLQICSTRVEQVTLRVSKNTNETRQKATFSYSKCLFIRSQLLSNTDRTRGSKQMQCIELKTVTKFPSSFHLFCTMVSSVWMKNSLSIVAASQSIAYSIPYALCATRTLLRTVNTNISCEFVVIDCNWLTPV